MSFVALVSLDAFRYDHMSNTRNGEQISPFIDSLVSEGLHFSQHISTGSGTSTSFPGIHASSLPLDHGYAGLNENHTSLAEVLNDNGVRTIGVTAQTSCSRIYNYNRGFDVFEDWVIEDDEEADSQQVTTGLKQRIADIIEATPVLSSVGSELKFQFEGIKDVYDPPPCPYPQAETVTDRSLSLVEHHVDSEDDVFLWTHYMEPHAPYYPPDKYVEKFHSGNFEVGHIRRVVRKARRACPEIVDGSMIDVVSKPETEALRDFYAASVNYVDNQLERLVTVLRERDMLDEGMLLFTADHGEELFDRGTLGHRAKMYEELIHVPLIARDFSGQYDQQATTNEVTSHVDIAPTVTELLGFQAPDTWRGLSLTDILEDADRALNREYVFSELSHTSGLGGEVNLEKVVSAVRSDRWKYIQNRQLDTEELYDICSDPGEQRDRIEEKRTVASELRNVLNDRLKDVTENSQEVEVSDSIQQQQLRELGYAE